MTMFHYEVLGADGYGNATENADTAIVVAIPPITDTIINVTYLHYTADDTAHTLSFMRPFNWTSVTADAAASATSLSINNDPGKYATYWAYNPGATPSTADNAVANADYVMVQLADGTWFTTQATGAVSSNTLALGALPTGGVKKGARVYFFGAAGDTDPNTRAVIPTITAAGSGVLGNKSRTILTSTLAGGFIFRTLHQGDPLLVYSNNITTAGSVDRMSVVYTRH